MEADPETIDAEKAAQWAAAGFNRISFGTQSFVDEELKAAGRMHRREDIYRAVPVLRAAGIRNISFDLIAGLPKQTHASWQQSLAEAMERNGLTTPVAARMLRVGERSGNMGEMMERIADFFDEELARWVAVMTRLIEPVLMIVIGLIIGVIVVLMYFPIFQLAGSIR